MWSNCWHDRRLPHVSPLEYKAHCDATLRHACLSLRHDVLGCAAAAVILPYPSTYVRSPYNAFETVSAQSCSMATKGCCASTSLTSLVQDTSVTYNCYTLNDPGTNDFAISVRLTLPCALKHRQAGYKWLQSVLIYGKLCQSTTWLDTQEGILTDCSLLPDQAASWDTRGLPRNRIAQW